MCLLSIVINIIVFSMEDFEKIENKINNLSEYDIVLKKKSPIAAVGLTVIGVALAVFGSTKLIGNDILEMTVLSIGVIIAVYGLIKLVLVCQKDAVDYMYAPTQKKLKPHKIYINASDRLKIDKCIESNDFSEMKTMSKETSSNNMLHIFATEDGGIAILQLLEYVPHFFEPASPVVVVRGGEARNIVEFINQK